LYDSLDGAAGQTQRESAPWSSEEAQQIKAALSKAKPEVKVKYYDGHAKPEERLEWRNCNVE
jgi:hypothetical protein